MGILISSFIGCGREYLKNTYGNKIKIFDAVDNIELNENDKESVESYFNKVMDYVNDNDIVFIGSSENIRLAFNEHNIDYDVFYPSKERRGEFIENLVRKRVKPNIIREVDKDFEKLIQEIDDDESPNCYKHKLQNQGEFIGNNTSLMQYINSLHQQNNEVENTNNDKG